MNQKNIKTYLKVGAGYCKKSLIPFHWDDIRDRGWFDLALETIKEEKETTACTQKSTDVILKLYPSNKNNNL